jgi:hypothetical protein
MSLPHKPLHFESTISSLVARSTGLYGLETFFLSISAVTKPGDKDKTTQPGMSSCMGLLRIRPISLTKLVLSVIRTCNLLFISEISCPVLVSKCDGRWREKCERDVLYWFELSRVQ